MTPGSNPPPPAKCEKPAPPPNPPGAMPAPLNFDDQGDITKPGPDQWRAPRRLPDVKYEDYPDHFFEWLYDNRHIYRKFKALALQARANGQKHWSARAIIHIMRWRMRIRQRGDATFKINNNYSPGLGRLAMAEYPELKGFFSTRRHPGTDD